MSQGTKSRLRRESQCSALFNNRGFGNTVLAVFALGLSVAACEVAMWDAPLSVEDIDNVDPNLVGEWFGVAHIADGFIWAEDSTPQEVVQFRYSPTMKGAEAFIARQAGAKYRWAIASVSTTRIGEEQYATLGTVALDDESKWDSDFSAGFLVVRYEYRSDDIIDIYFAGNSEAEAVSSDIRGGLNAADAVVGEAGPPPGVPDEEGATIILPSGTPPQSAFYRSADMRRQFAEGRGRELFSIHFGTFVRTPEAEQVLSAETVTLGEGR